MIGCCCTDGSAVDPRPAGATHGPTGRRSSLFFIYMCVCVCTIQLLTDGGGVFCGVRFGMKA